MVICLIALPAFAVLALFSAKYRPFAKEAFNCVFKRMTLRKCDTGFDKKLKAKITGKLMSRSPKTGAFVYKNFEAISWAFTVVMLVSLIYSSIAVYNILVYNNCNGPSGYCPITGSYGTEQCTALNDTNQNISSGNAIASTKDISISNNAYSLTSVSINRGSSVKWTNLDTRPHQVQLTDVTSSPVLNKGKSWTYTFKKPGSYAFRDSELPYMAGLVSVS